MVVDKPPTQRALPYILEASAKSTFEASSSMEPRSSGWWLRSRVGTQPEGICGGHRNEKGQGM
ncbi:hypothetical protein Pyn_08652 [Prunus yedoensis var. nudiflora]|uniref:Uncharacterized protein n=1 Tax=Prunus yedoensis var. nudiflora TaxID=2094558 RepID=A0A314XG61_PRUYE|nr:hypothetical protein Pyn_08652 [Prunus yedoensis var. nudiflora]